MFLGVNIISEKVSIESIIGAEGSRDTLSPSAGFLGGQSPLGTFLGSKEHLDWLPTDLNVAKIITVQEYKCTKN